MNRWRTQNEAASLPTCDLRFIARQPILNRNKETFGYELLFRSNWSNYFSGDAESSTKSVIDETLEFGMASLVGHSSPFINCTYSTLVDDTVSLLPVTSVLEVLETVAVDDALLAACKKLIARGYRIALDDFDFSPQWEPILPLADFIKVDFLASTEAQRQGLAQKLSRSNVQLLAEKIEDQAAFEQAMQEGFHLFQGYFFARPVVMARPSLPSVMQRMRLFAKLRKPEMNTSRLLALLKEEPAISLRVLRLANTALMGPRGVIRDLRTALVVVGENRFRKLALGALTSEVTGDATSELHQRILQRGRVCEAMAELLGAKSEQLYFFGILSVIKPILDLSRSEIDSMLTLEPELLDALEGEQNRYATLLQAVSNFERGRWASFAEGSERLGLGEHTLAEHCRRSQSWAMEVVFESALAA